MSENSARFQVVSTKEAIALGALDPEEYDENDYYRQYLVDTLNDPARLVGHDGGEPEDQILCRDWRWVVKELNRLNEEHEAKARERCWVDTIDNT